LLPRTTSYSDASFSRFWTRDFISEKLVEGVVLKPFTKLSAKSFYSLSSVDGFDDIDGIKGLVSSSFLFS